MSVLGHLGNYNTSSTRTHVRFIFSTHAAAGGNVAPNSAFEAADIRIYKATDGAAHSATQRASSNGITMTSPFDSLTGVHEVDIDLTDNTDASFYVAGFYTVVLAPDETVDSQTITGIVLCTFEIGVPAVNTIQLSGTVQTARDIGASVLLSSGTGTGQVKLSSGYVAPNWGDVGNPTTSLNLSGTTIATTQKVDVETIKTNPVVNGGTITFPTGATLASTTNITAAAGCAVSSLGANVITAASAASDFGAEIQVLITGGAYALSTDVNGRVRIVDGTGTGELNTASGNVFATLVDGPHGGSSATLTLDALVLTAGFEPTTNNAIADAVWDEILSGHAVSGSTGAALSAAGSAGDPWSTALPGAYSAGTAGYIVGTNLNALITSRMATYTQPTGFLAATFPGTVSSYAGADTSGTTTLLSRLSSTRAGYLDNLSGGAAALEATAQSILADTGTDGVVVNAAGLATDAVNEIRAAITGGAYALDTDANGRIRIVDGTATGELDTASGLVKISGTTQTFDALQTVLNSAHGSGSWATATGFAVAGDAMALTTSERNSVADALLDRTSGIESGVTFRQAQRAMAAILAGLIADAGTATETYKGIGQSSGGTTRVTATVDVDGNRSAITLNL